MQDISARFGGLYPRKTRPHSRAKDPRNAKIGPRSRLVDPRTRKID
jgi:hypothetical protein